jgi:hypothetical protein
VKKDITKKWVAKILLKISDQNLNACTFLNPKVVKNPEICDHGTCRGLPDGTFSNQKSKFSRVLYVMNNVGIFYI